MDPSPEEREPDYRFTLANERTFLAWIRTALALLAGGLALHQFSSRLASQGAVLAMSCALVAVAGVLAVSGFVHWGRNQRAMRRALPLPGTLLVPLLALVLAALSAFSILLLVQS